MALTRRLRWPAVAVAALVAATAASCSTSGDAGGGELAEAELTFPGDDWAEASPDALGLDAGVIDELAAEAEEASSDCFLVARHGRIADERYWRGTGPDDAHEVYSITKSIASTLVGLAQGDGALRVDDRASAFVREWQGTDSEDVTIAQLLSQTSGRQRDLATDYLAVIAAPDRTAYSVGLGQEAPPGTTWAYSNTGVQVLERVLSRATGVEPDRYARELLFDRIGMDDTDLTSDLSGRTTLAFGARTTCRDLARFGLLFLQDGAWGDEQVLPAGWVEAATTPSSDLNEGYGYLWWLNREGRIVSSALAVSATGDETPLEGREVPGAPTDLVWALGLGNQILQIHPDTGTIVVRIGETDLPFGVDPFTEADAARLVTEGIVS